MGTPDFAVPSLEALLDSRHQVAAVVTRPDRPSGRGLKLRPPPVKAVAEKHGLPVLQPVKVRDGSFLDSVTSFAPDVLVVVAYGRILPRPVLMAAPHGGVNLHASLLPKYRGAAPVAWAIARGETVTGITTMRMVEELDAGDIYLQRSTPIGPEETAGELESRLAELGAPFLVETLDALARGEMAGIPQDDAKATFAPVLTKSDGSIDWTMSAREIACRTRAFDPWPTAYTSLGGRGLRIRKARVPAAPPRSGDAAPGTIVEAGRSRLLVACGEGSVLELVEVQPAGRRRMRAADAVAGRYLTAGARLG